ncbi:hypothetical protein C8Q79DRAFT_623820 [Trametes meyenii]|nr:hypothetical protein C8Q79DRAFT_623820 [Trametes meyenii]
MQQTKSANRQRSGSLSPLISRLSDDILHSIFLLLRSWIRFPGETDDVAFDTPLRHERTDGPGLPLWAMPIVLSHVCTRWRTVALTSPRLWTFIRITGTFANRVMMNEFLERAGTSLPLSILFTPSRAATRLATPDADAADLGPSSWDLLGSASVATDHALRIAALAVDLREPDARLLLAHLQAHPLPRLHTLRVDTYPDGSPGASTVSFVGAGVGAYPRSLRMLHVSRAPLAWLPFRELVSLDLAYVRVPALSLLLATLRKSPRLEVLVLRAPVESVDHWVAELEPPAELSRLRVLALASDSPDEKGALAVLRYTSFPPATRVHLHLSEGPQTCLHEGCASLHRIAAAVTHAELVRDRIRGRATLRSSLSQPGPALTVDYPGGFFDEPQWSAGSGLCQALLAVPLPALTHFTLALEDWEDQPPSVTHLEMLFGALPGLVELCTRIHRHYVLALASALGRRQDPTAPPRTIVCTRLRKWTLRWCGGHPSVDDFRQVERCCASRAEAGVMLALLETTVQPPPAVLPNLKRVVEALSVVR